MRGARERNALGRNEDSKLAVMGGDGLDRPADAPKRHPKCSPRRHMRDRARWRCEELCAWRPKALSARRRQRRSGLVIKKVEERCSPRHC